VFQNVDEFDSFVNRLVAPNETKVSNTPARNAREQRAACLIVRNMLNIFDTMMSEKYQRISDDIQTVLDKLRARAILTPLAEEGAFRLEKKGANGYSVTLKVDTKAFRSIGLKKWSNRKFGNTDLMEDLSRFRCYDTTGNPDNLTRALDDIAKHIFSGKVVIGEKGGLLNHQLI
jgi:hypothetical protein